jgi:transposase
MPNVQQLLAAVTRLTAENAALREKETAQSAEVARLGQELALVRQRLDLLLRRMFGRSSEQLTPGQLDLFLVKAGDEPGNAPVVALPESDGRPGRRGPRPDREAPRWPENLPVVEQIIEPREVEAAPNQWRLIGTEVSEQLDYEPARFFRRRLVRRKYVHRANALRPPVIAPLPPVLQERGLPAPGLLAALIVGKYCDHLPLHRQEAVFASRHAVYLPRATLARWMALAAEWLRPIYQSIRAGVMAAGYVQVDETPIRYLAPGHGQTKLGYLWTALSPGGDAFYHWETSRAADCLRRVIPTNFHGICQCDAYAAYASFAKHEARITLAGCWAHARRNFYEAREQTPLRAQWLLRQIGLLYHIEEDLREARAGPRLRAAIRASQSAPICARIHRALQRCKMSGRYLPRSSFGQALDYALSQWSLLGVYLHDGRLELDNNLVENAIRPTALGKKNWLFVGAAHAGERSAILYTIVESCRRRGLDPLAYLRDVLTRLPYATNRTVDQLTPQNWRKAQKQLSQAA